MKNRKHSLKEELVAKGMKWREKAAIFVSSVFVDWEEDSKKEPEYSETMVEDEVCFLKPGSAESERIINLVGMMKNDG